MKLASSVPASSGRHAVLEVGLLMAFLPSRPQISMSISSLPTVFRVMSLIRLLAIFISVAQSQTWRDVASAKLLCKSV